MIIALFPNRQKKRSKSIAVSIREFLVSRGVTVVVDDENAEEFEAAPISSIDPNEIKYMLSMGGDGTILQLIHRHPDILAPVLGINLGSLGFMADVPISEIYPSLQDLLAGAYHVENRVMMQGGLGQEQHGFAVNDIVIHRAQNPCLVDLAIHVDGRYLNTFSADGVILSTPSGSTAYSLAAGGPILAPELEALVMTPISPHTISNRPIVLLPSQEIQIQYLSERDPVECTYDGISSKPMNTGEVFTITPCARRFSLVRLHRRDFYSTLRSKLGWTGKLKH
ncbi:MAG: NAD(+) kinase [Waddliaceae bacterium]|nr:NAD(+) kinase [Waddliaceae bacterium]